MSRLLLRQRTIEGEEQPSVNLTPLIDVVFVILIMFILLAPLMEMENIELAHASSQSDHVESMSKESGPIVIKVNSDDSLSMNNIPINLDQLKNLLIEAKMQHPQATPQLLQDKRAAFGTYQSVKNLIEESGFEDMDLVLKPAP